MRREPLRTNTARLHEAIEKSVSANGAILHLRLLMRSSSSRARLVTTRFGEKSGAGVCTSLARARTDARVVVE